MDVTDFPSQSSEIQKGIEQQMTLSRTSGCATIAIVALKAVITTQTKRLAKDSQSESIIVWVTTREEGLKALAA